MPYFHLVGYTLPKLYLSNHSYSHLENLKLGDESLKPGFHIIVTIVWIAGVVHSDPNDRNDYMETRL